MIKILHTLFYYYPSEIGGPANSLYWINNNISSQDFEVHVVATSSGVRSVEKALEHYRSTSQKVVFTSPNLFEFFSKSFKRLKGIDIIQFSSLFFKPTLPLIVISLLFRKKIILSPRGELYESALNVKTRSKKVWIFILKLFQKNIHFHATNETERKLIEKFFPKHKSITIIPNYIELPRKQEASIGNQFIFIGRINSIKNLDILIEAFAEFVQNKETQNYELVILGEARLPEELDYKERLLQLIEQKYTNKVKFLGHISGKDKFKLIAQSKALFLVSKSENFGNVVLESLSQGTPVIATHGTPWEMLEEKRIGFWISPQKKEILNSMEKINGLSTSDYQLMRVNAFKIVKSKFEIKENIKIWEEYYKNIH